MGFYTTGIALADINGDGYKDVIAANGNDMGLQSVTVYYNNKQGKFAKRPSWLSADLDYNTGVAVGDINADGWIDVAVATGLGPEGDLGGGRVKVYLNRGGQLAKTPSYESADRYSAFGCALGDADGDGDLDLAVGIMVEGGKLEGSVRIYQNNNGTLDRSPTWRSDDATRAGGLIFADMDQDGLLDLSVAASRSRVYSAKLGEGGAVHLAKTPSFVSTTESFAALFGDAGRLGDRKSLALAISYNDVCYQMGTACGSSHFEVYNPPDDAVAWRSPKGGLGSGVLLADVNQDGRVDLLAARWGVDKPSGAPLEIYLGEGESFHSSPAFTSDTSSVIEAIAVADLVQAPAQLREVSETFRIASPSAVVTLSRQIIEDIKEVRKNGAVLDPKATARVPGRSWISFAERLRPGDEIRVTYSYSAALDIVLANFDCNIGNYIFYNSLHY